MLENIKSNYRIKIFFLHTNEKRKLKIVKYNKILQKNININLNNYKFFTGKYIIYESNRIGKEYDGYDDTLKFEGEYIKGERNWKGKEYRDVDKLLFEGEYLIGKRNAKGKRYYLYNGELRFEDEYLYGKRNGKGKEYLEGKLSFEGEYLNDKEWIGTRYDYEGNILWIK